MAELLLEAGANVEERVSIYHAEEVPTPILYMYLLWKSRCPCPATPREKNIEAWFGTPGSGHGDLGGWKESPEGAEGHIQGA